MKIKQAQTFLIYAALIAVIIGSLVVISKYVKRSLQGRIRESADVFGGGAQYEPGLTRANY